jgi:hypothetical protein
MIKYKCNDILVDVTLFASGMMVVGRGELQLVSEEESRMLGAAVLSQRR